MITLISIFFLQFSHAQLVSEKLSWKEMSRNKPEAVVTPLRLQKKAETEKKWSDCAGWGKTNMTKFPNLKGWVLTSWLHCAREISQEKKNSEALIAPLKQVESSPALTLSGAWHGALIAETLKARLFTIDSLEKTHPAETWRHIELLTEQKDRLDKSQRAKLFERAAELAQTQAQLRAAQFFFEESLAEQENKAVREKLSSILFALNEKNTTAAVDSRQDFVSEAEEKMEERIKGSTKTNDLMTLIEDCVTYLNQFPGGRRAKWAHDKVLDIYQSFNERSDDSNTEKMKALQDRALSLMERADAIRQMEWARQLHRRSDFSGSLRMAEKSLEGLAKTSSAAILLYVAGRSSEMLGDYKKAKKYFEQYADGHSGGDDLIEVLFRLGLTHIRLGQASSAIAIFEKLLTLKGNDRYELSSRYWLARSLQATNNTRALTEVDTILTKYPFSYYGLRLRLERASGWLEWPTAVKLDKDLKADLFLFSTHKKTWDRAQTLAKNGWLQEAMSELTDLPTPNSAVAKVLYAKKLNEWQIFPPVIRLINEAGDVDPSLRSLDVVSLSLPQIYRELIESQALKQKLNPLLVRSLIRQESAFGPKAISASNAFGLMQLIGPTAQEVAGELGLRHVSVPEDVFAPEMNVQMGSYYIAKMIRQFSGNVPMGLAAYNAGPNKMQAFVQSRGELRELMSKPSSDPWDEIWFDEIPWFETSFYVKAILRNVMLYKAADKTMAANSSPEPDQRRVQFGSVLWSDLVLQ